MSTMEQKQTTFSKFRSAAAKSLRERKQNPKAGNGDIFVEFFLISNTLAKGSPNATFPEIQQLKPLQSIAPLPSTIKMATAAKPPTPLRPMPRMESSKPQLMPKEPPPPPPPVPNMVSHRPLQYKQSRSHRQRMQAIQSRHCIRAATAAAVACASTMAAQVRREAIDAINRRNIHRQQSFADEQDHATRNTNLLSKALALIREMDPPYLEKLCYAIHDQMTKC
ncbi:hypothetical protein KR044_007158 [Drosophila immigrans]|nr:hypothetical protein KR044_007158 [Drosophila immigrans]